jgi:hypothetical protein
MARLSDRRLGVSAADDRGLREFIVGGSTLKALDR